MSTQGRNAILTAVACAGFLALFTVATFSARTDRTNHENMVLERGHVPTQEMHEVRAAGTWQGRLIDAGCPDRSRFFLALPSSRSAAQPGSVTAVSTSAYGINVSPDTAQAERSDAVAHHVPDLHTRQQEYSCAVTGITRAFAVELPDGQIKNLDEGGNTYAMELFEHTPNGEAVMSGRERGAKPQVSVTGTMRGNQIIAESIRLL